MTNNPQINKTPPPSKPTKKRVLWIALFIGFIFSLLIAHFFHIQITEGAKWAQIAQRQHYLVIKEPFIRGSFYSNPFIKQGHPAVPQNFVMDIPKFHLYADPQSIPAHLKEEIALNLTHLLVMPEAQSKNLLEHLNKKSRSRKITVWLDKDTQNDILSWWRPFAKKNKIPFNALFFVRDYQRCHPWGKMLGQALHTVQNDKDEKTHLAVPTGGLELSLDHYLKGKQGKRRLMRSPRNSFETGEVISYPENGADIYLTINPELQTIAEEEIEKGVKKSKAKCGWVVMMEPQSGEVLALAQYPFFNPEFYQSYFNSPEKMEHTKSKAVTDANEPGSAFKAFTVAIALKANQELISRGETPLFSPDEKISTSSGKFPGRSKPISDTSLHQFLNLDMGMQKSSNIYMGRLSERIVNRLGNDWYRQQLELFGFGLKTGIELPAESAGSLPKPGKKHRNGALEWSTPTPFSLAIGHNIQATTIQLARAYCVLANGGYLVQPTLVRMVIKSYPCGKEEVLVDNTCPDKQKMLPKILDKNIRDRVVESMKYVTKPGGTAVKADIPGYTEVAKTSTAKKIVNGQYSEKLYCPLIAGFFPADQPALVLVVVIDEPEYGYIPGIGKNHHGGNCTAGVFREIGKRSLEFLGIPSDDPYGYPPGDPRADASRTVWMPETKKLQDNYDKWNKVTQNK